MKAIRVKSNCHFNLISILKLFILTNDNRELKLAPFEAEYNVSENIDQTENWSTIDEIISFYCSNLLNVFPSITIK